MEETELKRDDMKDAVSAVVKDYIKLFPDEFAAFRKGVQVRLGSQSDEFGTMKGSEVIMRALFEMPETLWSAMQMKLTPLTVAWFRTKEGSRWFVRAFPQFKVIEKV